MSIAVMTAVWRHSPYKQTGLLCQLALADWADDSGVCWPSVDTVARKARCSRRAAQYAIRQMEQDGELRVEQTAMGLRYHFATRYLEGCRICTPPGKPVEGTPPGKGAESAPYTSYTPEPPEREHSPTPSAESESPLIQRARAAYGLFRECHSDCMRVTYDQFLRSVQRYPRANLTQCIEDFGRKKAGGHMAFPLQAFEGFLRADETKAATQPKAGNPADLRKQAAEAARRQRYEDAVTETVQECQRHLAERHAEILAAADLKYADLVVDGKTVSEGAGVAMAATRSVRAWLAGDQRTAVG